MITKLYSGAVIGISGVLIEVEVDVANRGFPTFAIVGLPNKSIDEAKDRVRTAITNSSFEMPESRITVNLAPADIPKVGSAFDLPIALGLLASSGFISTTQSNDNIFVGELSLFGKVRPIPGIISIALMAKEKGITNIFLPVENREEASTIQGIHIYPVDSLVQVVNHLTNKTIIEVYTRKEIKEDVKTYEFDFCDIRGQEQPKRAMEIAAAGFHNINLKGVPGAGKTMLCRALPSILPPLNETEAIEVSKIYSALGKNSLMNERPFRSPHHTTSRIGLIGGGAVPVPGEISLAHRGVLFLDEVPEFPRSTLEALRQPMEDGYVTISRASGSLTFPSKFMLVVASNPCPCGYLNHPSRKCSCSAALILLYRKKLSGPLLDRIDLHVNVLATEQERLIEHSNQESSITIRQRVLMAREIQSQRFKSTNIQSNSEMNSAAVKCFCKLSFEATAILNASIEKFSLSTRSYFKIIKVAQTIADLEASSVIENFHLTEALQYRSIEE